jgi:hypothetical protein
MAVRGLALSGADGVFPFWHSEPAAFISRSLLSGSIALESGLDLTFVGSSDDGPEEFGQGRAE